MARATGTLSRWVVWFVAFSAPVILGTAAFAQDADRAVLQQYDARLAPEDVAAANGGTDVKIQRGMIDLQAGRDFQAYKLFFSVDANDPRFTSADYLQGKAMDRWCASDLADCSRYARAWYDSLVFDDNQKKAQADARHPEAAFARDAAQHIKRGMDSSQTLDTRLEAAEACKPAAARYRSLAPKDPDFDTGIEDAGQCFDWPDGFTVPASPEMEADLDAYLDRVAVADRIGPVVDENDKDHDVKVGREFARRGFEELQAKHWFQAHYDFTEALNALIGVQGANEGALAQLYDAQSIAGWRQADPADFGKYARLIADNDYAVAIAPANDGDPPRKPDDGVALEHQFPEQFMLETAYGNAMSADVLHPMTDASWALMNTTCELLKAAYSQVSTNAYQQARLNLTTSVIAADDHAKSDCRQYVLDQRADAEESALMKRPEAQAAMKAFVADAKAKGLPELQTNVGSYFASLAAAKGRPPAEAQQIGSALAGSVLPYMAKYNNDGLVDVAERTQADALISGAGQDKVVTAVDAAVADYKLHKSRSAALAVGHAAAGLH